MIKYTITSGSPSQIEIRALEQAIAAHKKNEEVEVVLKSKWGKPIMRAPLDRNP